MVGFEARLSVTCLAPIALFRRSNRTLRKTTPAVPVVVQPLAREDRKLSLASATLTARPSLIAAAPASLPSAAWATHGGHAAAAA
eukprot:scaffold32872_cov84-Phaeocystis_antarctica.AAC.7